MILFLVVGIKNWVDHMLLSSNKTWCIEQLIASTSIDKDEGIVVVQIGHVGDFSYAMIFYVWVC